jgi:hypothetical protein
MEEETTLKTKGGSSKKTSDEKRGNPKKCKRAHKKGI